MKKKLIVFMLILTAVFACYATATGYSAGTASHTTLYADSIRGKSSDTVAINDKLSASHADFAIEGKNSGDTGIVGKLGLATEAVNGLHSNGNIGKLGEITYGVFGLNGAAGHYGYIGGDMFAIYGHHFSGNGGYIGGSLIGIAATNAGGSSGYLAGPVYAVRGDNANGNYGYLGSGSYGVYGNCMTADCFGVYTPDKIYAGNGIKVSSAAQCQDSSAAAACSLNDIAEDVYSKDELEDGDVAIIDSEYDEHVRLSSKPYDTHVAGIISANPAFHIQSYETGVPLALAGRVKTKASAENGPIKRGDLLTTSSTPGHLMKCESREKCLGAIVGKAWEPLDKGKGKITVLVMLG